MLETARVTRVMMNDNNCGKLWTDGEISLDFGLNRAEKILFLHFKNPGRFWFKSETLIRRVGEDPLTFEIYKSWGIRK